MNYIDSSFIGHLLNIKRKLKIHKKELFLTSINSHILDLSLGGEIDQLFTVFTSPTDALRKLSSKEKK